MSSSQSSFLVLEYSSTTKSCLLCELIISLGCEIVLVAFACHMFFGSRTKRLDTEEFLALLLLLWSTSQNHIGQPVAENKLQKYHSPVARLVGVPEH